jgi:hypothetical protein
MLKALTVPTEALDVLSTGLVIVRVSEAPILKLSDVASVLVIPSVTLNVAILNIFWKGVVSYF